MEGVCQCLLARRLGYLLDAEMSNLCLEAEELALMLSGLQNSLKESPQVKDADPGSPYLPFDP